MQDSILYIVLVLLCVVIYLLISQRSRKDEKNHEEIDKQIRQICQETTFNINNSGKIGAEYIQQLIGTKI